MGLPFLPFAGPALFIPSYELFSRMALAAPLALRGSAPPESVELALAALLLSAGR